MGSGPTYALDIKHLCFEISNATCVRLGSQNWTLKQKQFRVLLPKTGRGFRGQPLVIPIIRKMAVLMIEQRYLQWIFSNI